VDLTIDVGDGQLPAQGALVTVAIPARNEERFIAACLDSVLAQDHSNLQVIVVDGASRDRTAHVVREYASRDSRVELVFNPRAITPKSLNLALQATRAKWFVRVDAHATVPPNYVSRAIAHLRTGRWQAVGGRVDPVGITPAGRAVAAAMSSRFGIGNAVHHYGAEPQPADHVPFPAYPTELLRALGGWDENLPTNQDFELDYRLAARGGRILYDPSLPISYVCQQSIAGVFRQFRRYGRGKADVVRLHPRSIRSRHLVAPGLVAAWGVAVPVGILFPPIAVAAFGPYLTALVLASVTTGRSVPDWRARIRVPAAFAAMHVAWGVGFWGGLARRDASPKPKRERLR
jgi:succinoglycan biosynthesis protein ExoA